MRKEWFLASATVIVTLLIVLGVLRWQAPLLLGLPVDLQLVQVSTEVPPFFEGVFRQEDYRSRNFIIPDPYLKRAKPLYPEETWVGPHDILGFRNRQIPNGATIIAIGDSQTYGNNAVLEENWPNQLRMKLNQPEQRLYSMAVGGWGAVEYLEILPKALHFQPRVVIVAFYTGNDPLESFRLAYASERWRSLLPDTSLAKEDLPAVVFPPPESEWWSVRFSDGVSTVFTAKLRLGSNQDHPAVHAGYEIMAEVARRLGATAGEHNIRLVFTILPTKELVYAEKVEREGKTPPDDYLELVRAEKRNLEKLAQQLRKVPGALYVDMLDAMQEAALSAASLYPRNINGHPIARGYAVIAETLSGEIGKVLSPLAPDSKTASQRFRSAFALQKSGRRDEAIRFYEEALALDPNHDQAVFNLSYALVSRAPADLQFAVSVLEPLAQRRPDYTEVLYRLGEAHRLRGDVAKAAESYRRFLNAGGHPDLAEQAQRRLRAWGREQPGRR